MQAFDPQTLHVEIKNPKFNEKEAAIDVDTELSAIGEEELAIAYCRLPRRITAFLQYTHSQYEVVGFSYDFEQSSREFGVIIKSKEKNE